MHFVCAREGSKSFVVGSVAHQANTLSWWRAKHIDRVCCAHSSHVMKSSFLSIAVLPLEPNPLLSREKKKPFERCSETFSWDIRWFSTRCWCCFRRQTKPFRTKNWNWHGNCIHSLRGHTRWKAENSICSLRGEWNGMQKIKWTDVLRRWSTNPHLFTVKVTRSERTHTTSRRHVNQSKSHIKKHTHSCCVYTPFYSEYSKYVYNNNGRNSCVPSTWWNIRVCCCAAKMNWIFPLRSFALWRWIAVNKSVLIFFLLFSRLANTLWSLGEKEKFIKYTRNG